MPVIRIVRSFVKIFMLDVWFAWKEIVKIYMKSTLLFLLLDQYIEQKDREEISSFLIHNDCFVDNTYGNLWNFMLIHFINSQINENNE